MSVSPAGEAPASLAARDVVKRFGEVVALDGVSLEVAPGACVALVGESGSGKTTLLRCFNRLVEPDAGRVSLGAEDVATLDAVRLRRHIGYVPQDGGLLPHWPVLRNVALVPRLLGASDAEAKARDALDLVGLEPRRYAARYPRELSGGQRQRVAMARALASGPSVILLDEPFGALDAITRADLQTMFIEVRRVRAATCVLVTHDLREAVRLADHVAVLRGGRLEQIAPSRALLGGPGTEYVARLIDRSGLGSGATLERGATPA